MHLTQKEQRQMEQVNRQHDIDDWKALKMGDRKALRKIYEAHVGALLQYGLRFSRDTQLVEDCIHDLFVDVWKKREGLGMTDSIRRYLLVALRRSIIRQNKKSAKVSDLEMGNDLEIPFSGSIEKSIIDDELGAENKSRLSKALSQLSARQQEAIYLKYHKNLQYEDVAEIMNINYQSVRNLVFNGIAKMRSLMTVLLVGLVHMFANLLN